VIEDVCERAENMGIAVSVAVVDGAGELVAFWKMDGAIGVSCPIAIDKAWTAAVCASPTADWAQITQPGQEEWGINTALGGRLVVQPGGVPLTVNGEMVGAVAVSGGTVAQDASCAEAGAQTLIQRSEIRLDVGETEGGDDVQGA
jgi:uncharacterized protein GlcG (DUF336 family)